ncbi:uncharacterized protein LOC108855530 [Raphanus sativus]|uniref:Uncharacterized protein LOC108855530 n=1 Tax=Raphanus sativus TaxID=3726 RepID=A0A9W3DN80_RAPSA|nr:uncharacterized protein LOC108855530 [Raphanus sativus]XP_056865311.1 uncharacterized protein LOC108855530 [Raphanus sativus]XP_056865312.1 uncharacterized protein LOC108855530 [Raphanus sativus]
MATTKKVIAICQAGGQFVTNKDGLLVYTNGDAYAIDIDHDTSLNDFRSELAENFGFSWETMTLKYFLPGNRKTLITISKDKDFKRMVSFSVDAPNVEVFVLPEESKAMIVSNMPASRSSRTTASEAVVPVVSAGDLVMRDNHDHDDDDDITTNDFQIDMGVVVMPDHVTSPLPCDFVLTDEKQQHIKPAQQWENTITGVDQRFSSFAEFRDSLHKYSIAHGFTYKYKKNDSHRVSVKCKSPGCPWRIAASRLSTTQLICIKKMNPRHTCERAVVKAGYRATRGWVGSIIKEKLKAFPDYKPKDIAEDIKREYGIQLNYSQAWRAKEIAREQLQGSYKEAYTQLPFFCEKIKETNPGSVASFVTKEDSSFHRLFISFYASLCGFKQGSRPLLFLDSIVLNSKYQGVMLVATAPYAEDGAFPLAFAVADSETEENWVWFLENLKSALADDDSRRITFVADFQNGLKSALPLVFGEAHHHHAYCLRHLAEKLNCDCKMWRLTGLPCSHAVAVIECIEKSPYEYCSRYLTSESFRLMYAESINPVPNGGMMMMAEEQIEGVVSVTPPPARRTPGRPKSKQVEPIEMIKRQLQCSNCKGLGHNKKTCKAGSQG